MSAELPATMHPSRSFQGLILTLHNYWADYGCVVLQPYDMEVGAGTFHPATTLRALGPKPWKAAYVQPSRRPKDGRYGENPNRLQHYYQYQVILKPNPPNLQELYLGSLAAIGVDPLLHDIRFVEDDWESPTLGAWGLGWECWCDGMEVSQFTYLHLYGGLFDVIAIALSHVIPIDPYDLRHILCALVGIGGIGAAAATARLIAGPRAGLIAAISLTLCGAWYGSMFNHTKDIPFAAAMMAATLFLIRIARRLPSPRAGDIAMFGLLAGAALGIRVIGLLLVVYVGFAIVLYLPRPWSGHRRTVSSFADQIDRCGYCPRWCSPMSS